MHPELFTLHFSGREIVVMSYSFFYLLATLFIFISSYVGVYMQGFTHKQIIGMLFFMLVSGFTGARVLHFIFNPQIYNAGQLNIFDFQMHGFTIVGGFAFAIIGGIIGGKIYNVNVWKFGDIVIPFGAFGIAIARIGCFLNGCCFGHVTRVPWGVQFPILSFAHQYQITHGLSNIFIVLSVHPTQIYELLYAVVGGIIVMYINRKKVFTGAGILFFGMWFSVFRTINMFFRQMPDTLLISQFQYSIIYLLIFTVCLILFFYKLSKIKKIS